MNRYPVWVRAWLLALAVCAGAVALSFAKLDVPVARHFWQLGWHPSGLSTALGAAVILALESAVLLTLLLARLFRGHLSRLAEALGVACLASICAYGINDQVLKLLFAVPDPVQVLQGARHTFFATDFGAGSFPSGHMVLAGSFAGVFMRLYRRSTGPFAALLLLAAVLLIVGDWHFISDVIAGAFIGLSGGILAAEGWLAHVSGGLLGS
jgi:membrane-associated phospholipid phosphatase